MKKLNLTEATALALEGKLLREDDVLTKLQSLNLDINQFSAGQLNKIKTGINKGLSNDKLKILANPAFDYTQMNQILLGFLHRLNTEEVLTYAKPDLTTANMFAIRSALESNLSEDQLNFIIDNKLGWWAKNIIKGFESGLTIDQAKVILKGYWLQDQIAIRKNLEKGLSEDDIRKIPDIDFKNN